MDEQRVYCSACGYNKRLLLEGKEGERLDYVIEADGWTPTADGKWICGTCAKQAGDISEPQ